VTSQTDACTGGPQGWAMDNSIYYDSTTQGAKKATVLSPAQVQGRSQGLKLCKMTPRVLYSRHRWSSRLDVQSSGVAIKVSAHSLPAISIVKMLALRQTAVAGPVGAPCKAVKGMQVHKRCSC
jgi:hypothetical protein